MLHASEATRSEIQKQKTPNCFSFSAPSSFSLRMYQMKQKETQKKTFFSRPLVLNKTIVKFQPR